MNSCRSLAGGLLDLLVLTPLAWVPAVPFSPRAEIARVDGERNAERWHDEGSRRGGRPERRHGPRIIYVVPVGLNCLAPTFACLLDTPASIGLPCWCLTTQGFVWGSVE